MSCNSTSNKVAGAACAAGISRLIGKYGFYAGAAVAGLGAALLAAKLAQSFKTWRSALAARRAFVADYNRKAAEINRLLTEAGDPPDGEHTRYHFFANGDGEYWGWTHSKEAAEKIAALNGWKIAPASSTLTEEEVMRTYNAALSAETEARL